VGLVLGGEGRNASVTNYLPWVNRCTNLENDKKGASSGFKKVKSGKKGVGRSTGLYGLKNFQKPEGVRGFWEVTLRVVYH